MLLFIFSNDINTKEISWLFVNMTYTEIAIRQSIWNLYTP